MPDTDRLSPLNHAPDEALPAPGMALCLSGGGYRAMVFHLGTLWRLYEAGLLQPLKRISSVSGGSITAGVLALAWDRLSFDPAADDFRRLVVDPVRGLAGRTLDVKAVLEGILLPGTIGERVARSYARHLFGDATLQSLPDSIRFVFNATNLQSAALWRFSKPFMGDYRVGLVDNPTVSLATAVAASSAFPPILSPVTLDLDPASFRPGSAQDLGSDPFRTRIVLGDGGIYDNLGLETVWKNYRSVLISDGGAKIEPQATPKTDWPRLSMRVLDIIDDQVRSLRKRAVMAGFEAPAGQAIARDGAYWSIRSSLDAFARRSDLPAPPERTAALAQLPTRLKALDRATQERLINWGYVVTDAALRSHVDAALPFPGDFPYPKTAL